MATKRLIGILTGGGDVPGLNSVIKSVVYQTTSMGYEVLGIRRGWEGLSHVQSGADSAANPALAIPTKATPQAPLQSPPQAGT